MVNCPKCGTPNPDAAALCLACGAPLEGQKFAQALDRAAQSSGSWPAVRIPQGDSPPPSTGSSASPFSGQGMVGAALSTPPVAPLSTPAASLNALNSLNAQAAYDGDHAPDAQADINRYLAQSQSKKKRRRILFALSGLLALVAASLYIVWSAQSEKRKRVATEFLTAFLAVDDGPMAEYWRCAVLAKREDIHRAKDNLVITSRLEQAFQADPEKQPERLRKECLPKLTAAKSAFAELTPPKEFGAALEQVNVQVTALRTAMEQYVAKLNKAKRLAASERDILEAGAAFHESSTTQTAEAVGYVNLLRCAIPNLTQVIRLVRQPPDTQGIVEHVYTSCKADPTYANTLRAKCISALGNSEKTKFYQLAQRRLAGDSRDLSAIKHCFQSINRDLFRDELGRVGRSFVEYRNALKRVVSQIAQPNDSTKGNVDPS